MIKKKLTIKDLSKEELVWAVEAAPLLNLFFTEERIAQCMFMRKLKAAKRIEDGFDASLKMIKRTRARQAKADLTRAHNARVDRYNQLLADLSALVERFPCLMKSEKKQPETAE